MRLFQYENRSVPESLPPQAESTTPVSPPGRLNRHFNWINDQSWNWFPFLSLRPERHEFIHANVILCYAALVFAPISVAGGLFIFFLCANSFGMMEEVSIWMGILGFVASLTTGVSHQYVCYHFWNLRARTLRDALQFRERGTVSLSPSRSPVENSPYRAPTSVGVSINLTGDYETPLPLRFLLVFLETVIVEGTLFALAVAPSAFWQSMFPGISTAGPYSMIRLAPVVTAVTLVACTALIESRASTSVRLIALAVRTLTAILLMGIAFLALTSTAMSSSPMGALAALILSIVIGSISVCVFAHCFFQAVRLMRQTTREEQRRFPLETPFGSTSHPPLMSDGERSW